MQRIQQIVSRQERKFECRFYDKKKGEGSRSSDSLAARHFVEENHKYVNLLENCKILKVVNVDERRLSRRVRNIERERLK